MTDQPASAPVFAVARPGDQAAALDCVLSQAFAPAVRSEHVATFLAAAASGNLSLDGLWEARQDGRLLGAAWVQLHSGGTAGVWPPRLTEPQPGIAERLLATVVEFLRERDVRIAQALLAMQSTADVELLKTAGFEELAELVYLLSLEAVFPQAAPECELGFEAYAPANHQRLADIVRRTYNQTLDCPRLNGVRSVEEVLAEYRSTGVFDPARWLLVRQAGQDIGCVLLAAHVDGAYWELMYMGLAPEARGRGWGAAVVRHAQWLARQAGCPRLVLAVDGSNAPAIAMYEQCGLIEWERRRVMAKFFGGGEQIEPRGK